VQSHQPIFTKELATLGAQLLVLSFADLERLRRWVPYFGRAFLNTADTDGSVVAASAAFARTRFLADLDRTAYHAHGLGRNSALRVYGLRILWQYVRWGLQGKPIRISDDARQRGGDFVVGRNGRLTLAHTCRDQADRPTADAILGALQEA
jgi:hypothetical protein